MESYVHSPDFVFAYTGALESLKAFIAACPSNAFERVPLELASNGGRYSLAQRLAAIVKPAPQLFVIGFGASEIQMIRQNNIT